MFLKVANILKKYGVDLQVWSYDKIKQNDDISSLFGDDEPTGADLSSVKPDKLHEPVLPVSSSDTQLAQIITGGVELQNDLIWLSTGDYPVDSIVKVSTQDGTYKVTGRSSYHGYSDLTIYSLKGDSGHDNKSDRV